MPKFVYIQLYPGQGGNVPAPLRIRADKLVEGKDGILLTVGDDQVGKFAPNAVQGWWIQDEAKPI